MVERFSLDRESGGPPVHHEEEISLLTYVCIYHTSLLHRHHHSPHLTPPQAPSLTTPHSSTGTITHHTLLPPHAPSLTTPHSSTPHSLHKHHHSPHLTPPHLTPSTPHSLHTHTGVLSASNRTGVAGLNLISVVRGWKATIRSTLKPMFTTMRQTAAMRKPLVGEKRMDHRKLCID